MDEQLDAAHRAAAPTLAPLGAGDVEELGRVHVQVWREAYADAMPAQYLATLDPERFAANWRLRLANPDQDATTLVARDEHGGIVGFVSAGPSRDEDPPTHRELYAINLLSRAHGTGLAQRMLDAALGDQDASLWVVETNHRARAFYSRNGFVVDGATSAHAPSGASEVRMVRRRDSGSQR